MEAYALHGNMHAAATATYFGKVVNYDHKMFIILPTGPVI